MWHQAGPRIYVRMPRADEAEHTPIYQSRWRQSPYTQNNGSLPYYPFPQTFEQTRQHGKRSKNGRRPWKNGRKRPKNGRKRPFSRFPDLGITSVSGFLLRTPRPPPPTDGSCARGLQNSRSRFRTLGLLSARIASDSVRHVVSYRPLHKSRRLIG